MTSNRPLPPKKLSTSYQGTGQPKPYQLISLAEVPQKARPAGQERFRSDHLTGKINLRLTVKTSAFVASGVVVMGSDLSSTTKNIPLIKTAVERDHSLVIPGSSLKGAIRSTYEAITRSCLCKISRNYKKNIAEEYSECTINIPRNQVNICPACQIFGAMDWQGLVHFTDAKCEKSGFNTGFMPSLYRPRPEERKAYFKNGKVAGRKFYYHAVKAVDKGQQQGIPVQQAGKEYTFTTQVRFMNLSQAELGALLIVLGQDADNKIALKLGGGKPIGMGTMVVEVTEVQRIQTSQEWRDRYSNYNSEPDSLTGKTLEEFIKSVIQSARTSQLVQSQQLQELAEVLKWPTDREAPEGVY